MNMVIVGIIAFLLLMNAVTFALFGMDKRRAIRNAQQSLNLRRIPEEILLTCAFCGGSLGALLGMFYFQHKTRQTNFRLLIPLFIVAHILFVVFLYANSETYITTFDYYYNSDKY